MKLKKILFIILFKIIFDLTNHVNAKELSNLALYSRCYAQVSQSFMPPQDPRTGAVRNGTKDPITACLEVLDMAKFTASGNTRIADANNPVAVSVLRTMHNLHSSWLEVTDFPNIADFGNNRDIRDLYDPTQPALYFTRALFGASVPYSDVVKSTDHLRPLRTTDDPGNSVSGQPKSASQFLSFKWAPNGTLLGAYDTDDMVWNYQFTSASGNPGSGTATAGRNAGGGIMGTPAYLLLTIAETADSYRANGSSVMARKWARSVYNDLLCRPLPVVRMGDAAAFVDTNSSSDFRKAQTCTVCHVSHDRLSGVVRNFRYQVVARFQQTPPAGGVFPTWLTINQSAETVWPINPDPNYAQRPPNGVFYFRNYLGELKNITNINGLNALGATIADQPDFYICAAKRYYEYFTGITVDTGDLGDASHPALSPINLQHRQEVIQLGLDLKNHQSLRTLIEKILRLPQYRKSDFE